MLFNWHDLVGIIGVVIVLAAYLLLQLETVSSTSMSYSVANGLGAVFILTSLVNEFNLSAFVIESAWLVISIVGLARCVLRKRSATAIE